MRRRTLPGTTLELTELGFGSASLGNLYLATPDDVAAAAVDAAWEAGIRYFDTAPHYGLGLSERRLGAALRGRPRDDYVLSTKVGRLIEPNPAPTPTDTDGFVVPGDRRRRWDFSRDGVRRSIDESLERMGLDRVDIAFVHDPDVSGVDGAAQTAAAALLELRDEGVVRAVGIGSNSAEAVAELLETTPIDTAMLAGRYTLLESAAGERVLAAAGDRRIVAVGVFNSGLLSAARPGADAHYDYAPAPAEVLARANRIVDVAERFGVTLPQAALAFPLRSDRVVARAVGMRTADEVRANAALAAAPVPEELWGALADEGLLG